MGLKISAKKSILLLNKFKSSFLIFASGQLLLIFAAFLDSMVAGNALDIEALKAVQISTPIQAFISFTGSLIASGVGARYFYLQNKGENNKAKSLIFSSILLSILLGVVSSLILFFIKDPFIHLFRVSEQCIEYAQDYYFWYIIIAAILPLFFLITELISRDYDTFLKVGGDISQCVSKIILSFILIKLLGISGLGLATFCSYIVATIIICIHFFKKKNSIKISLKFNFADLWPSFKLSFGKAFSFFRSAITQFVINIIISLVIGSDYLPIFTILSFLMTLGGVPRRISLSLAPMVTMAYSTKNKNDYDFCLKFLKKFTLIFTPIFSIATIALSPLILILYNIPFDSSLYLYGILSIVIFSPTYFFSTYARGYCDFYVSIQIPSVYIINEIETLVFSVILTIGFIYLFGVIGLIIGFSISQIISYVFLALYLYIKNKPHHIFKPLEVDEQQYSVDLILNDKNIKECVKYFKNYIDKFDINEKLKEDILCEIEECTTAILRHNPNRKVTNRITMCIGEKTIRIFNKNNGRLIPQEEKQKEFENVENHPHFNALYEVSDFALYGSSSFNCAYLTIPRN